MRTRSAQRWCTGRYDYIVVSYGRLQQQILASLLLYVLSQQMRANNPPLTCCILFWRDDSVSWFHLTILCTVRSTCHCGGGSKVQRTVSCFFCSYGEVCGKIRSPWTTARGVRTSNCIHKLQLQFVKNLTRTHSPLDISSHSSFHVYPRFKRS
jgi:hypothetical protein